MLDFLLIQVAKVVAPKRAKLAEAEGTYEGVMAGLKEKQGELQVRMCSCVAEGKRLWKCWRRGQQCVWRSWSGRGASGT
jgi:hypothetical protein